MSKELEALEEIKEFVEPFSDLKDFTDYFSIIETALKRNVELEKIEYTQNTINDFYPDTKKMIDDLVDLVGTKMCDFLKEGRMYTRTGVLETLGFAIRYVKTFAFGEEFNENEKVGVNHRKLKAFEIIKEKKVDVGLLVSCDNVEHYNYRVDEKWKTFSRRLTKEEFDLLKEALL